MVDEAFSSIYINRQRVVHMRQKAVVDGKRSGCAVAAATARDNDSLDAIDELRVRDSSARGVHVRFNADGFPAVAEAKVAQRWTVKIVKVKSRVCVVNLLLSVRIYRAPR